MGPKKKIDMISVNGLSTVKCVFFNLVLLLKRANSTENCRSGESAVISSMRVREHLKAIHPKGAKYAGTQGSEHPELQPSPLHQDAPGRQRESLVGRKHGEEEVSHKKHLCTILIPKKKLR